MCIVTHHTAHSLSKATARRTPAERSFFALGGRFPRQPPAFIDLCWPPVANSQLAAAPAVLQASANALCALEFRPRRHTATALETLGVHSPCSIRLAGGVRRDRSRTFT